MAFEIITIISQQDDKRFQFRQELGCYSSQLLYVDQLYVLASVSVS